MRTNFLAILFILSIVSSTYSQITFSNAADVKSYLDGTWQLKLHVNGWTGETIFPTDSIDFHLVFDASTSNDSTIACSGILNEVTIATSEVDVYHDDDFYWGLKNLPGVPFDMFSTLFMYEEAVQLDSFDLHDGAFDGNAYRFQKVESPNALNEVSDNIKFELYPNPSAGEVFWTEVSSSEIESIRVMDVNGRIVKVESTVLDNRIDLSDYSGVLFLQFKMKDGTRKDKIVVRK